MRFASLVLLSLLVVPHAADACPAMSIVIQPATPNGGTIVDGGGVLLFASRQMGGNRPERFTLTDGTTDVDTVRTDIAPGLAVLAPKTHAKRTLTFADASGAKRTIQEDDAAAPLAAPKVTKILATRAPKPPRLKGYPFGSATTTVELAAEPGTDVFAIVIYAVDKTGATPRAWLRTNGTKTLTLSLGGKGCNGIGLGGLAVGETAAIAIVDNAGRVSPRSKSIRVTAK